MILLPLRGAKIMVFSIGGDAPAYDPKPLRGYKQKKSERI